MKLEKRFLDERQQEYRNKVGHQSFLLLLYLILIDTALNGLGVTWLPYPANMMALLTVCAGLYQTRLVTGGAYVPPGEEKSARRKKTFVIVGFSVAVAAIAAVLLVRGGFVQPLAATGQEDNSALVLFIISAVSLVILLVGSIASRRQSKNTDD